MVEIGSSLNAIEARWTLKLSCVIDVREFVKQHESFLLLQLLVLQTYKSFLF